MSVLFVVACSLTKATGGTATFDQGATIASAARRHAERLAARRDEVREFVKNRESADWQGIPLRSLDYNRDLVKGLEFGGRKSGAYLPALDRYEGRFFQALGDTGTRRVHTRSEPPDRREGHRDRSSPRTPMRSRARVDAPSSPRRDEPFRAGAGHRAHARPPSSAPSAGRPRALATTRHWRKRVRRRSSPSPGACGSLKMRTLRGYILSPSGSWLDPVQATEF